MKYVFIRDHRGAFPVDLMCRSLGVGNSGNSNLENGTTYWGPVTEKPDQFSILNDGSLNQDGFQ